MIKLPLSTCQLLIYISCPGLKPDWIMFCSCTGSSGSNSLTLTSCFLFLFICPPPSPACMDEILLGCAVAGKLAPTHSILYHHMPCHFGVKDFDPTFLCRISWEAFSSQAHIQGQYMLLWISLYRSLPAGQKPHCSHFWKLRAALKAAAETSVLWNISRLWSSVRC